MNFCLISVDIVNVKKSEKALSYSKKQWSNCKLKKKHTPKQFSTERTPLKEKARGESPGRKSRVPNPSFPRV